MAPPSLMRKLRRRGSGLLSHGRLEGQRAGLRFNASYLALTGLFGSSLFGVGEMRGLIISFPGAGQLTVYKTASHPLPNWILTAMDYYYYTHFADGKAEA